MAQDQCLCKSWERDEAEEESKGQIIKDPVCHAEDLGLYPDAGGKLLEKFKQGSDMLRLAI